MEHLLEIRNLKMYFGGVHAVDDITTYVDAKEMLGIIGPNGSGKTTLINAITGVYTATEGSIHFHNQDITRKKLDDMTALGIARTFQNLRIFKAMNALDNVLVGQHLSLESNLFDAIFRTKRYKKCEEKARETAMDALRMVGLEKHVYDYAGAMPYGMQKKLEIARALVMRPKLLILDEPTAGMNAVESQEQISLIKKIQHEHEIAVILIEHNMKLMMEMADRILAMDAGKEIAQGLPAEIQNNQLVIKAYLGEE